jgi:Mlc titration factor MtfA (ptsG expression regulator)
MFGQPHGFSHLFICIGATISATTWLQGSSSELFDKVKSITGILSGKHKKILKRDFSFYSKLSPNLLKLFEQKVEYYFYKKVFVDAQGNPAEDKKKLLVAAYAAQLTFGLKDFYFLHLKKVIVYEEKFYSVKSDKIVSWEISTDGIISLAWKIFYSELRSERISSPIGLMIMANALKLEQYTFFKEQIYFNNAALYFANSNLVTREDNRTMFEAKDMKNREDFLIACLIHYFSKPMELKNRYPDLFRKIDYTLFKEIA